MVEFGNEQKRLLWFEIGEKVVRGAYVYGKARQSWWQKLFGITPAPVLREQLEEVSLAQARAAFNDFLNVKDGDFSLETADDGYSLDFTYHKNPAGDRLEVWHGDDFENDFLSIEDAKALIDIFYRENFREAIADFVKKRKINPPAVL